MKKILCFALMAMFVAACSTPEQKAEALIKDYLKMYLLIPETYKPVKTIVREVNSPYGDVKLWEDVKELKDMDLELKTAEHEMNLSKNNIANWSDSHSAYGVNSYQEAKEKYDKATAKLERLEKKKNKLLDEVKNILQKEPEFIGYSALHNFRAGNNAGETSMGNIVVFFDKEMEEITYALEAEEFKILGDYLKEEIQKEE